MTSMVRLYNDGPDDLEVSFGGGRAVVVKANGSINITTRRTMDLRSPDPLTDAEMAHHMGVPLDTYRESNKPPPRVVEP